MQEQRCNKCDNLITGKNFRADQGTVVHKICPREKSETIKTKKDIKSAAKTKRIKTTGGETKIGYIHELIKSDPTIPFKKLQAEVLKKYGEKTAGAGNLKRTLFTVKQKYNVQLSS